MTKTPHNYNNTMKTPHINDTTMKRGIACAALLLALGVSCKADITLCTTCPCLPKIDATSCKIDVDYRIDNRKLRCDEQIPSTSQNSEYLAKPVNKPTLTVDVTDGTPSQGILIMFDPDIPNNYDVELGWLHWVARVNIAQGTGVLTEDRAFLNYSGPTPPEGSGVHRYQFFLYDSTDLSTTFSDSDRKENICDIVEANTLPAPIASSQFRFERETPSVVTRPACPPTTAGTDQCRIGVVYTQISANKLTFNELIDKRHETYLANRRNKPTLTVEVADFPHDKGILVMFDPDIPHNTDVKVGWMHWVARVNIDQATGVLREDHVFLAYNGPTPPRSSGVHRYQLFLFENTADTMPFSSTVQRDLFVDFNRRTDLCKVIAQLGHSVVSFQFQFGVVSGQKKTSTTASCNGQLP